MQVIPVLLAGGSGTRLWPLSRKAFPKQFAPLVDQTSLFRASVRRLTGPQFGAPLVITGSDFRFIVTEQLQDEGIDGATVLIEPEGRNTAPAVLAAAIWLERTAPDAMMLVAPSDHSIPDAGAFGRAVDIGRAAAADGQLVTFGITPTRPETGYGYLELAEAAGGGVAPLQRFVEKPDLATAQRLMESGNHLWNAGIFLFTVTAILQAYAKHAPGMIDAVRQAVEKAESDLSFQRIDPAAWSQVEDISIDYAVMEKADNLAVVPFSGGWTDLGDWESVSREMQRDGAGNSVTGGATVLDCENTLLRAEQDGMAVVGLGLKDLVVVSTRDAVLVADKSRAQDVKNVVGVLKEQGAPQAADFQWDRRPWGMFETLARGDRFQVKRIVVKPGGILSLQSHHHRAEHWIVVQGTAKVTIDEEVKLVSENESVYVPLGSVHRMENPGKVPMVLIEVQTGSYLGEDDIVRLEDVYDRGQGAKG
ncbi:mannose-1-phosphate guanylyltransferase/mannose-6-phosphate isomerase [Marimonas lutisalis]|uniref:mannose-1-phosphate guanylyltransferase/mannose-6-phosphate isomerase n=1 Tax=Marimonas lutisalis TaxID=2545756 RepID=UPI0010F9610A|nr:mannose-1-phosphate guanylyltransferase/mannose-6-phosphate isomerase [Marimonas lutisalis]